MNWNTVGLVIFLVLFCYGIFRYRSRIHFQHLVSFRKKPIIYLALLRTKVGLGLMDFIAKRFAVFLGPFSTLGIVIGFIGMVGVTFEIIRGTVDLLTSPVATGAAALVLPIEAKGVVYVPFVIWLLCLGIIIAIHEFGHGVIARLYNIPIKSSGLAAFGIGVPILPAAFVEPDEEILAKKPMKQQLAVFAAGPFVNIVLALLLLPIVFFATMPAVEGLYDYEGVKINEITKDASYGITQSGLAVGAVATSLDGTKTNTMNSLLDVLATKKAGESVVLTTLTDSVENTYTIVLGEHPSKQGAGYLGIIGESIKTLKQDSFSSHAMIYLHEFLMWLCVLNLGIGLFNLLPIGIVDGGRMIKLVFERYFKTHHAKAAYATVSACCLFVVLFGVFINFIK